MTYSPYSPHTWVDVPAGGTAPPGSPDLEASTLNQIEAGISGAYVFRPNEVFVVRKDPATGFWPSGWAADGRTPVYSGGAVDSGVRPSSDPMSPVCMWVGADPSPSIVTTGSAGMYDGDMRFVQ